MRTLALLGMLCVFAGCSGLEAREPMPPSVGDASTRDRPASVQVAASYTASDPATSNSPGRFSPAVDTKRIGDRTTEVFLARSKGAAPTLGLEVNVARADVKYEGQTAIFPLKIFFTVFFFPFDVPNYFISSDKFALVLQATWKLLDNGQVIAEGTAEGKQSGRFGDFSRGWYFVGYLRMPSPLKGSEFQEIVDVLLPGAEDSLAEALVVEVEKALEVGGGRVNSGAK